ncbi:MAG: alpha-ribazole phosphatase family protein [Magnetococcales bacterium]|nr:alpha-ribazole phosphatase family protein [Magnetococcales bacterium]
MKKYLGTEVPVGVVDLLRHGEVEGGACFRGSTDDILSKNGWQAMESAARKSAPWDQIVTSPLLRCRQVAADLSEQQKTPLLLETDFREICFGEWEGLSAEQIMQRDSEGLRRFWQNPEQNSPPGGEKTRDFQKRVLTAWAGLLASFPNSHTLLITHGGVIRTILADLLGISLGASFAIDVPWASVTRIHLQIDEPEQIVVAKLAVLGGGL